jgi:hypothetical protein
VYPAGRFLTPEVARLRRFCTGGPSATRWHEACAGTPPKWQPRDACAAANAKDVATMSINLKALRSTPARAANAPRCRGGASSLLRLSRADSMRLPRGPDWAQWAQRAAALLGAAAPALPAFGSSEFGAGSMR